jgi:hypothetical protein
MEETEYRIVQVADSIFHVERAYHYTLRYWPWSKPVAKTRWVVGAGLPDSALPFKSQEAAQKWIDDRRKYPIVVKYPA